MSIRTPISRERAKRLAWMGSSVTVMGLVGFLLTSEARWGAVLALGVAALAILGVRLWLTARPR